MADSEVPTEETASSPPEDTSSSPADEVAGDSLADQQNEGSSAVVEDNQL